MAQTIDLIGDRWTLLILRAALYGVRRFDDFHAELGVPRTVLSGRLKRLTEAGLLERRAYRRSGQRTRAEYVLTASGVALRPALMMLTQWGDAWLGEGPAPISFATPEGDRVRAGFVAPDGTEAHGDDLRVILRK